MSILRKTRMRAYSSVDTIDEWFGNQTVTTVYEAHTIRSDSQQSLPMWVFSGSLMELTSVPCELVSLLSNPLLFQKFSWFYCPILFRFSVKKWSQIFKCAGDKPWFISPTGFLSFGSNLQWVWFLVFWIGFQLKP